MLLGKKMGNKKGAALRPRLLVTLYFQNSKLEGVKASFFQDYFTNGMS
jgi:hypothetical protein